MSKRIVGRREDCAEGLDEVLEIGALNPNFREWMKFVHWERALHSTFWTTSSQLSCSFLPCLHALR